MKIFARHARFIAILVSLTASLPGQTTPRAAAPTITVLVDANDAPRKMFHAHLTIPASPGELTLYYPKWIPGEHGPTGPVQELAGLHFTGNGQLLKWRRDLVDGWTFHVEVPQGVARVDAALDYMSPTGREGIYTGGQSATDKMTVVSWNTLVLYPAGWTSDELTYQATLRLPSGWKSGTALPITSQSGAETQFKPVSLTTLVDSPVIAGEYLKVVPLAENPHQEMDIAADSAGALAVSAEVLTPYKNLTDQALKLFGAQHFRDYHFLYSLSDHVAHFGLEHHESNDSRVGERYLVDPELRLLEAGLLPHEYVHSWNGKYRRPADLATANYEDPMKDDLLWVYEGLTSYLGDVLSARAGLRTPEQLRDSVALIAAQLDHTPGRSWRNLQDTADGVPAMQGALGEWESWRRDLDYYDEDVLNWLWVDTIIRQQTNGKKSMDDFCHLFEGPPSGPPEVKTYTFDDVMNALNQVAPYDWAGFWSVRLANHGPGAPLGGIEGSGWKLVYDENRSELLRITEHEHEEVNAGYSVGLLLKEDGRIVDTIEGLPAAQAGIGPGMKLIAVNGRRFSGDVLRDALKAGKSSSEPLQLLIENTEYYKSYSLNYHGGEKYPHLVRDESKPDMLSEIIRPR
ncbi:MAG: M61 family metallopeptidase [Acidobacteriaceae bacterium]|nr:M61 family metallopeptidase [Acidobacteriaceae bacterium]